MNKLELIKQLPDLLPCDSGFGSFLESQTDNEIAECFHANIDFCLAHNFPSKEWIKLNYGAEMEEKGVFIDKKLVRKSLKRIALLGKCDFEVEFTDYDTSRIYVKHNSELYIHASGHSFIVVDALDTSVVHVRTKDNARVVVNLYSQAKCNGTAKVVRKNRETYEL